MRSVPQQEQLTGAVYQKREDAVRTVQSSIRRQYGTFELEKECNLYANGKTSGIGWIDALNHHYRILSVERK